MKVFAETFLKKSFCNFKKLKKESVKIQGKSAGHEPCTFAFRLSKKAQTAKKEQNKDSKNQNTIKKI